MVYKKRKKNPVLDDETDEEAGVDVSKPSTGEKVVALDQFRKK